MWNVSFCVVYMMSAIESKYVARWPSSSMRQLNGVKFCGLKVFYVFCWVYCLRLIF